METVQQLEDTSESTVDAITYTIRGIPTFLVDRFWPFALPYIKRALDHTAGEIDAADIRQLCLAQDMQLWLVGNSEGRIVGAGTTEIVRYPRRTICRIVTLSGSNFAEWAKQTEPIIADWAQNNGCDGIEAWVRRGFVPTLKAIGYQPRFVAVIRDLNAPLDSTKH